LIYARNPKFQITNCREITNSKQQYRYTVISKLNLEIPNHKIDFHWYMLNTEIPNRRGSKAEIVEAKWRDYRERKRYLGWSLMELQRKRKSDDGEGWGSDGVAERGRAALIVTFICLAYMNLICLVVDQPTVWHFIILF
jgi:hypothetical protein